MSAPDESGRRLRNDLQDEDAREGDGLAEAVESTRRIEGERDGPADGEDATTDE